MVYCPLPGPSRVDLSLGCVAQATPWELGVPRLRGFVYHGCTPVMVSHACGDPLSIDNVVYEWFHCSTLAIQNDG